MKRLHKRHRNCSSYGIRCAGHPVTLRGAAITQWCRVAAGQATEPQTPGFLARMKGKWEMLGIYGASVEVDLFTAPAFAAALSAEIDGADSRIVFIDCSAITFMDISAFHALIYAHRYATEHGHRLVVGNLRPNCNLAIRLCDWNNELTIEPALDSAAAHRGASVSSLLDRRRKTKAATPTRQRHLVLALSPQATRER